MNLDDASLPASESGSLSLQYDLSHPSEKVWRALTTPELLTQWLLPIVELDLQPGAEFRFQAPPQPGWDGVVHCQLLHIDEPRTIRYGWVVGDLDTVVTFTLDPTASGTRLTITQTGFTPGQKKNFGGAKYDWKMMGDRLVELLTTIA